MTTNIRSFIYHNQIMVVLFAIILGFVFPTIFRPFIPYTSELLILIFFTSSLRLSLHELKTYAHDWKMLILSAFFMLIFLPIAMWLPVKIFAPEWALPFLIVGAMPTGMTTALIADYFGGKTTLALVITSVTSLVAPITIPFVFLMTVGQNIQLPVVRMCAELMITMVLPFALAAIMQRKAPKFTKKHDTLWREISVVAFGLLIATIVADTSHGVSIQLGWNDVAVLIVMLGYMAILTWASYLMTWWRTPPERATIALCMVYMNNTLALYIANRYFNLENTIPRLLLILVAVNALLPLVRWFAKRGAKARAPIHHKLQPFHLP